MDAGNKSIVLASGGIDSSLAAYLAQEDGPIKLLYIDYNQCINDLKSVRKISKWLNSPLYISRVIIPLSKYKKTTNYIPVRNQILISIGIAFCVENGCSQLIIGANKDDYRDYIDCRRSFFKSINQLIKLYGNITVKTPLLNYSKADIVSYALHKGVPLQHTHTCYTPIKNKACGKCNSCKLRLKAFDTLHIEDPVKYV